MDTSCILSATRAQNEAGNDWCKYFGQNMQSTSCGGSSGLTCSELVPRMVDACRAFQYETGTDPPPSELCKVNGAE